MIIHVPSPVLDTIDPNELGRMLASDEQLDRIRLVPHVRPGQKRSSLGIEDCHNEGAREARCVR